MISPNAISLFDYDLPKRLIAQFPSRRRDESRLLVYHRDSGQIEHLRFREIIRFLRPGDALVVNDTKVFKARLIGRRPTGAKVEILLVRPAERDPATTWIALLRPSRRVKRGEAIEFEGGSLLRLAQDAGGGSWLVEFASSAARERIIRTSGHVPLPPYIAREDIPTDVRRYQTVFADRNKRGAIAAPTAGFHFTRSITRQIQTAGVELIKITLHVGPGTFKPITTDDITRHRVDPEYAELSPSAAHRLSHTKSTGGRVFAVGTTSVRTLESAANRKGDIRPVAGMIDLYIKPGHRFLVVDHLITNFHLPKSSLLVLVAAFAGREEILRVYEEAIREEYRFYSYGDAMLIL